MYIYICIFIQICMYIFTMNAFWFRPRSGLGSGLGRPQPRPFQGQGCSQALKYIYMFVMSNIHIYIIPATASHRAVYVAHCASLHLCPLYRASPTIVSSERTFTCICITTSSLSGVQQHDKVLLLLSGCLLFDQCHIACLAGKQRKV